MSETEYEDEDELRDHDSVFALLHVRWRNTLKRAGQEVGPRYKRTLAFWLFERGLFGTICFDAFFGLWLANTMFGSVANDIAPPYFNLYTSSWAGLGWIATYGGNPHFARPSKYFWLGLSMAIFHVLWVTWVRYVETMRMEKYRLEDDTK